MTGAEHNTLNLHDLLDWSGTDHLLQIDGEAGDVVNVQHAINVYLSANSDVVVDGVHHATDDTGHTTIGEHQYVAHHTADGLRTILVDGEVVVNFLP